MGLFNDRQWPRVTWNDADLLGRLIDEFFAADGDIRPPIDQMIELSGSRPSDPERPVWVWLAAWSAATAGEDGDPLLALKIAAFTLAWRERCVASRRFALVLHPLNADSDELVEIQQNAVDAARELSDGNDFHDVEDVTVPRLLVYLYGSRSPAEDGMPANAGDPRLAALDVNRMFLMERRCANQWYTFVDELLAQDEQVLAAAPVLSFDIRVSALVLTDERVVIVFPPKFFVGNARFVEIHLADVLTVHYRAGSRVAAAWAGYGVRDTVRATRQLVIESRSGDYAVTFGAGGVRSDEGPAWPNLILGATRARRAPANPEPRPVIAAPAPNLAEQLTTLVQLHKDGALTDQEFAAAKARLLS